MEQRLGRRARANIADSVKFEVEYLSHKKNGAPG